MTALTELGDFTATELGLTQASNLFLNDRPETPDRVLCIYTYPGGGPNYVQESVYPSTERLQIQVVARDRLFVDAEALCTEAWLALSAVRNAVLGGTRWLSIEPNQSPVEMKRDSRNRSLVFFNASVVREVPVVS